MKRAAIYVRVSTVEQKKHGLSVDNQILALTEYCNSNGYTIGGIYNDAGISARKRYTRRPALLKLLADCDEGKIDIILFTKLDRWFRSVGDYYEVQNVLDKHKIPWRSIWEDYETETSSGIFKVNIMLSVAQSEADRTSERLKSTFAYKRQKGDYCGKAPLGYVVKGGDLLKDETIKEAMDVFFQTYLESLSLAKALNKGKELGLKVNRNHILRLIHNPVYMGAAAGNYKCEPYITEAEYNLIQQTLKSRTRDSKSKNRTYLFSGICKCGYCGRNLSSRSVLRTHADGTQVYHIKYECQYTYGTKSACPHIQITQPVLERYLIKELDKIIGDYIIKVQSENQKLNPNALNKRKAIESKLSRLLILFEEGDISEETYRAKRDALKTELSLIKIEPIPVPKPLPDNWKEIYNGLDQEHRKSFWKKIIKSITVTNETKNDPKVELR